MKKTIFPFSMIWALLLSACGIAYVPGSGKISSEMRQVSDFDQVVFSAPGRMDLVQGGSEGLKIETDDNLLQYIHTSVQGRTLYIEVAAAVQLAPSNDVHYTLNVKTLKAFNLEGSARVSSTGLQGDQLTLSLDGSGEIALGDVKLDTLNFGLNGSGSLDVKTLAAKKVTLDLNGSGRGTLNGLAADELEARINGSGRYVLNGKVTRQSLETIGSGKYEAQKLESQQAQVTVTGSGDSKVWATQALDISIFGSGAVVYQGSPRVTQQISGSGSVNSIE